MWLEGTVGGNEFTDESLKHVLSVHVLHVLALYGRGFTAQGLEALRRDNIMSRVNNLFRIDTGLRKDDVAGICLNYREGKVPSPWIEDLNKLSVSVIVATTVKTDVADPEGAAPANDATRRFALGGGVLLLGGVLVASLVRRRLAKAA